jgi:transcriptional regulator with XRE-family HTH domain
MKRKIEPVYLDFGIRVSKIRIVIGLSQLELAERLGYERSSISNIEAGRQRVLLDDVGRFAKALGCSPKHLMKGIWW